MQSHKLRDNHRRELDPVPEWLGDEVLEQVGVGDELPLVEFLADEIESEQKCAA